MLQILPAAKKFCQSNPSLSASEILPAAKKN
jgi:hypothetical protein